MAIPLDQNNHVGPLIDKMAVEAYRNAIEKAREEGGEVLAGDEVMDGEGYGSGCYVAPTIVSVSSDACIVQEETFAPILYVMEIQ